MKINKVHLLFEQSGTFKRAFLALGIPAFDYDILDDFGETDYKIDLFAEIESAFDDKPSVFDSFSSDDLIFAFFPCVRFENQIMLFFRLDSKWEYEFDANGNLLGKTGSVTNDSKDWVVRDVFVNRYDPTVDASTVLGLKPFWNAMGSTGLSFATGAMAPLNNQWLSCSITSASLDTEFTLYCSGFEGVEETPITSLKAWSDGRRLVVENDQPADISVFDVLGRVVASENQTTRCEFNLTPGLYIVGYSKSRLKVIVNE